MQRTMVPTLQRCFSFREHRLRQPGVQSAEFLRAVDRRIRPLVVALNRAGYPTRSSCSGHILGTPDAWCVAECPVAVAYDAWKRLTRRRQAYSLTWTIQPILCPVQDGTLAVKITAQSPRSLWGLLPLTRRLAEDSEQIVALLQLIAREHEQEQRERHQHDEKATMAKEPRSPRIQSQAGWVAAHRGIGSNSLATSPTRDHEAVVYTSLMAKQATALIGTLDTLPTLIDKVQAIADLNHDGWRPWVVPEAYFLAHRRIVVFLRPH